MLFLFLWYRVINLCFSLANSAYQTQKSDVRPNKKISVLRVTGLNIVGRVGRHVFFVSFSGKKMHLKAFPNLKMHKIIFYSENLKKF